MIGEQTRRVILGALEQGGTVEEIASEMNLLESDVLLVAGSRLKPGQEEDAGFDITADQLATLRGHAFQLALGAEDQAIQAKLTMWLIDRRAPAKTNSGGVNFLQINQQIEEARTKTAALFATYSNPSQPQPQPQ